MAEHAKAIEFLGDSRDVLRDLPRPVRTAIGTALNVAQWGRKEDYA